MLSTNNSFKIHFRITVDEIAAIYKADDGGSDVMNDKMSLEHFSSINAVFHFYGYIQYYAYESKILKKYST